MTEPPSSQSVKSFFNLIFFGEPARTITSLVMCDFHRQQEKEERSKRIGNRITNKPVKGKAEIQDAYTMSMLSLSHAINSTYGPGF